MFKNEEQKINSVLQKLMKTHTHLSDGMQQNSIEMIWEKVLGKTIAKYTNKLFLRKGTLTVNITSASLRNELQFEKEKILDKLNKELEYQSIKEIKIR